MKILRQKVLPTLSIIGLYALLLAGMLQPEILSAQGMSPWGATATGSGTGAVATDTIWDAAGDLVQGTGANTAAKLSAGTAGAYLRSAGAAAANVWSTLILPNAGTIYRLPVFSAANTMTELAAAGASGEILAGVSGAIPLWTANPSISTANITGANALTLGSSRTIDGVARFKSGTALNDFYHEIRGANFAANTLWIFPTAVPGGANYLLNVDANGVMDYTDPATFAPLASPVFTTSAETPYLILGSAATAADAGAIRMANATSIAWEYPGGTGVDTTLTVDASDDLVAALVAATDLFKITTGNLFVGAGTPTQAQNGEDAYVTGKLEVDEAIYADSGVTSGTGSFTTTSGDVSGSRVIGYSTVSSLIASVSNDTPATTGSLDFWRARAAAANVADDDVLGEIRFKGQTAGGVESGAIIRAVVNGTPGSGDLPSELIFATSADGSATPTTRMTINALGSVIIDGAQFKVPSSNADPTATAGYLRHDSTVTNHADGALRWHDGTNIRQVVDMVAATAEGCTNGYVVAYNSSTDLWYCKVDAVDGGNAATVTVAASADATSSVAFFETTDGSLAAKTDPGLTYDATTNILTATGGFTGALTGTATGLAGTPNITVGTISAGATGFGVGSDGDVTAKSYSTTRTAGADQYGEWLERTGVSDRSIKLTATTAVAAPVWSATTYTGMNFSALNLATTGSIQGGIKINTDANGMSESEMTAVGLYGSLFIATGSGTWTLPTAVEGMSMCLKDSGGTAHDLILDVQAGDDISLDGETEDTNGDGITNAAASTKGDFVCVVAISAGHWATLGAKGVWVAQ